MSNKNGNIEIAVINLVNAVVQLQENPFTKEWAKKTLDRWDQDRGEEWIYTRKEGQFSKSDLEVAFNRWMDHYTKDPEGFSDGHADALLHLNQKLNGQHPTYGQECAELIERYLEQGE